jgi:hypothetical protein
MAWQAVHIVIGFSSESLPEWLRNCVVDLQFDIEPHD